jgi:hypothetical protein
MIFCRWGLWVLLVRGLGLISTVSKCQAWIPGLGTCSEAMGTIPWHTELGQISHGEGQVLEGLGQYGELRMC